MQQLIQRICVDCDSVKTSLTETGFFKWYFLDKDKSKPICAKCYNKRYNIRHIRFKDKRILLETNPRIGICSNCGQSIAKGEIEKTDMHHTKYDPKNPEAYTLELCVRCHNRERMIKKNRK